MNPRFHNSTMLGKLAVVVLAMFGFGYALVPIYNAICQMTGVNILALAELVVPGEKAKVPANTQVDTGRTITVEFDANSRGPWQFKPAQSSLQVHPGEVMTVMYEFQNTQNLSAAHFNKLEGFCFNEYTLEAGEKKSWPVVFVIDPRLSKDVRTITLSYTFFEVGGKIPPAPIATVATKVLGS